MKNRNLLSSDDWATPTYFYDRLNNLYHFNFDPCPFHHDTTEWDGLNISWKRRNFINPPYDLKLKSLFIEKAIEESKKSKLCVCLLPVSTSTKLFHQLIMPNADVIRFVKSRIPFIGINSKGEYINWHLWDRIAPEGVVHKKSAGQHDSMIVIFNGLRKNEKEDSPAIEVSVLQ